MYTNMKNNIKKNIFQINFKILINTIIEYK